MMLAMAVTMPHSTCWRWPAADDFRAAENVSKAVGGMQEADCYGEGGICLKG